MRCRCFLALLTLGSAWASAEVSTPLGGAFEGWDSYTFGESIKGGELTLLPSIAQNWIVRHDAGFARTVRISAVIKPLPTHGTQWKIAGVGCYHDTSNYWHLALVETPTGDRHFIELSEMRDGTWNAQSNLPDEIVVNRADWQTGHSYTFALTLTLSGISGEVSDGGQVLFRETRRFDPGQPAVKAGRAALETTLMPATFSQVVAVQSDWAPSLPSPAGPKLPAYPGQVGASTFGLVQDAGKWWFRDPAGKRFLMVTTDHVNYNVHNCEALGYAPYHRYVEQKYGSEARWGEEQLRRLQAWNFNCLSTGASPSLWHHGLPHAAFVPFGSAFSDISAITPKTTWTGWPDVFDPRWPEYCRFTARQYASESKGDPWLIGAMIDNEMEWYGKSGTDWGIAIDAWKLPSDRPAKKALIQQFKTFYKGDLAAFNSDFGLKLVSFDELQMVPPEVKTKGAADALMSFVSEAADRYFSVIVNALRKEDPTHLVLGCRFAFDAPEPALKAAGKYCDVVSVNIYPRVNMATGEVLGLSEHLDRIEALTHRPIMVTEWGFPGLDAHDSKGVPLPSTVGAGMRVDTQAQRAVCFRAMQTALFSEPYVIGSSHFMFADEPALGIGSTFAENSNYGLVSESDQPYAELVAGATQTNSRVTAIHENGPIPRPSAMGWLIRNSGSAAIRVNGLHYSVTMPRLRLMKDSDSGDVFDHILVPSGGGWWDLGHYGIVIWVQENGRSDWQSMTRLEAVSAVGAQEIRLIASNDRARCRVNLKFGSACPYFLAQVDSLTSLSSTPWTLKGYYHYVLWRADEAALAQPYGSGIPNYWIPVGAWVTPSVPFGLGAIPEQEGLISTMFFKDTSLHADCWRKLEQPMDQGRKWLAAKDEPWVAVFAVPKLPNGKLDLSGVVASP